MATTLGLCGCVGRHGNACNIERNHVVDAAVSDEMKFIQAVVAEVDRARALFPDSNSLISGLALGEESSEAQRALLHIYEGKGGESNLYLECVQTAAMALRLALESADRAGWKGNKHGCGGSYEVGSGGHVPGVAGEGCEACDRDFGEPKASPLKRHSAKPRNG